jgi:hypothetical protein
MLFLFGGERGPVTFPAFKAGDAVLRGPGGGFDFHTLPPTYLLSVPCCLIVFHKWNMFQLNGFHRIALRLRDGVRIDLESRANVRMPHLFLQHGDRCALVGKFGSKSVSENVESGKLRRYSKFLEHWVQTVLDDIVSTPRECALQIRKEQSPRIVAPPFFK